MQRAHVLGISLAAIALLGLATISSKDLVLFNHSPSMPYGLYMRVSETPRRGAIVTVRARDVAPELAQERLFEEDGDRFLKRIAAVGGQTVCSNGQRLTIDGRMIQRFRTDSAARSPAYWIGCRRLRADEAFLLGDSSDSFDGRYWGPIDARLIEGVWRRL